MSFAQASSREIILLQDDVGSETVIAFVVAFCKYRGEAGKEKDGAHHCLSY